MLNIGSMCTGARVLAVKHDLAKLQLTSPGEGVSSPWPETPTRACIFLLHVCLFTLSPHDSDHHLHRAPPPLTHSHHYHHHSHTHTPPPPPRPTCSVHQGGGEGRPQQTCGEALAAHWVGADTEGTQDGLAATACKVGSSSRSSGSGSNGSLGNGSLSTPGGGSSSRGSTGCVDGSCSHGISVWRVWRCQRVCRSLWVGARLRV